MLQMEKSSEFLLTGSESNSSCFSAYSSDDQFVDYSGSKLDDGSHVIMTCVSRESDSKERRKRTTSTPKSMKDRNLLHPKTAKMHKSDLYGDSQYSLKFSPSNIQYGNEINDDQFFTTEKLLQGNNLRMKHNLQVGENGKSVVQKGSPYHANIETSNTEKRESLSRHQKRDSLLPPGTGVTASSGEHTHEVSPSATSRKSCDHAHNTRTQAKVHRSSLPLPYSNVAGSDIASRLSLDGISSRSFPRKISSVVFRGSGGSTACRSSVGYSAVELDAVRTVILQKVVNSSWYPKDLQSQHDASGDLDEIVNTLCKLFECVKSDEAPSVHSPQPAFYMYKKLCSFPPPINLCMCVYLI